MKKLMRLAVGMGVLMSVLMGAALHAQDLTGNWQGTLKAGKDLRMILVVTKENGSLQAKLYSIDESAQPFRVSSISEDGSTVKFANELNGTSYEGKLNAADDTITGTWTQGVTSLPLILSRPTRETAWEIPAPPPPRKPMAADAEPGIEVATIKPNDKDGGTMQVLTFRGRHLITVNSSLADLMMFAYSVQMKQIAGAPDWIAKDRYDVDATPDQEGTPTADQVRIMIRKLLADRFQLKFHHEKGSFRPSSSPLERMVQSCSRRNRTVICMVSACRLPRPASCCLHTTHPFRPLQIFCNHSFWTGLWWIKLA